MLASCADKELTVGSRKGDGEAENALEGGGEV
jgi:hypothetical protein